MGNPEECRETVLGFRGKGLTNGSPHAYVEYHEDNIIVSPELSSHRIYKV